jgi:outer membrane protein assembly factor BamB
MIATRFISLALILLFAPLIYFTVSAQGMTYSNWFFVPASIVWMLLLSFWYLGFGKKTFKRRALNLGMGLVSIVIIALVLSRLLRYEGSTSGSSFPRFSWAWQSEEDSVEKLDTPHNDGGISPERLKGAVRNLNQIFGPERNGMWPEAEFNTDWAQHPPLEVWRRPVGAGWSSFSVSGKQSVTQEQIGDDETVTCLDLFTGETLWRYQNKDVRLLLTKTDTPMASMGGEGPRSTPTIHEGKVYSLGATGILNCLDLETGQKVWSRQVIEEFEGVNHDWGLANSPMILKDQGTVVVAGSKNAGTNLIAFNLESGKTVWTCGGLGASYSSARIIEYFGIPQIICVNLKNVTGHNPSTGAALWTYNWPGNFPRVGQPNKIGDAGLLLTASYGMGSPLLKLSKKGRDWSVERTWNSTRMKTKFSSAAIIGGYAYGLDEGRLACIDLADGSIVWKGEKYGFGQQLLFGNHLLIQTEKGAIVIGQLTPKGFTETGRIDNALSSMTWNAPAVAGRFLLVRNDREAICYLLPEA